MLVKSVEKHVLVFRLSARFLIKWRPMFTPFNQTILPVIVEIQIFTDFFNALVMIFTRFWHHNINIGGGGCWFFPECFVVVAQTKRLLLINRFCLNHRWTLIIAIHKLIIIVDIPPKDLKSRVRILSQFKSSSCCEIRSCFEQHSELHLVVSFRHF